MNGISIVFSRRDPVDLRRATVIAAHNGSRLAGHAALPDQPTRVSFAKPDPGGDIVYEDPRAAPAAPRLLWSSPASQADPIGALMVRNRQSGTYRLADHWRGLGGAALTRFGQTGEHYTQTMVDAPSGASPEMLGGMTQEQRAQDAADVAAKERAALNGVSTYAAKAELSIRTRSGQDVRLQIAVNPDSGGMRGSMVELTASGSLGAAERDAVAQLAEGLDRTLEGLGQQEAVILDLSGLVAYNRSAIAGIDLTVLNGQPSQRSDSFALHLDDEKQSVMLQGEEETLRVEVARPVQPVVTPAAQRAAAIQRMLDHIEAAGERSHAMPYQIDQLKAAFAQFQSAAVANPAEQADAPKDEPDAPDLADTVDAKVSSRLSGLADFDASLTGDSHRTNRFGSFNEVGHVDYQLSQTTSVDKTSRGNQLVKQMASESLSAEFRKAPGPDSTLDVTTGTHTTTRVHDAATVTTLIESTARGIESALRRTDERRHLTVTGPAKEGSPLLQSSPLQRSYIERLG